MDSINFAAIGGGKAQEAAVRELRRRGIPFDANRAPTHVLLRIPTGGMETPLPEGVKVFGGGKKPEEVPEEAYTDLLKDPYFTAENGAITAQCALRLLLEETEDTLDHSRVLILGWGKIGKCLARMLRGLGAEVTVYARKEADRAMLTALGYGTAAEVPGIHPEIVVNTVPALLTETVNPGTVYLDLASLPGIGGDRVIRARGLPGKLAPAASGRLIAGTVLRYLGEEPE